MRLIDKIFDNFESIRSFSKEIDILSSMTMSYDEKMTIMMDLTSNQNIDGYRLDPHGISVFPPGGEIYFTFIGNSKIIMNYNDKGLFVDQYLMTIRSILDLESVINKDEVMLILSDSENILKKEVKNHDVY